MTAYFHVCFICFPGARMKESREDKRERNEEEEEEIATHFCWWHRFGGNFFLWSIGSLRTVAYGDSYIIRLPADAGPGLPTAQWIPFAGHPSVPPHCITKHHKTALVNRGRIGQYWGLFQTLIAVMCNTHWCSNCTGISKRRIRPPPQTRDRNILSWPVK